MLPLRSAQAARRAERSTFPGVAWPVAPNGMELLHQVVVGCHDGRLLTRNCPAVQVIHFDPYPCSPGLIPLSVLLPPTRLSSGGDGNTTHLLLIGAVDAGCC